MFFLSNLCFLCLGTCKKTKPVLMENSDDMLVDKKLKYCLPEMDVDFHCEIPKYRCSDCINKLENLYKFKQMCLQNNTYLRNYLQTLASTGESYKYLSVKLSDVKYQIQLQSVSSDQTLTTIGNDDELRSREVKDEKLEAVFIKQMKCDSGELPSLFEENNEIVVKEELLSSEDRVDDEFDPQLVKNTIGSDDELRSREVQNEKLETVFIKQMKCDGGELPSLFEENNEIVVKEELSSEDRVDDDFDPQLVKNIKCDLISSDSDVSVSRIEDIKFVDVKYCNTDSDSENNLTKPIKNKDILIKHENHIDITNYECLICKKKFNGQKHLIEHKTIHTGIRNHECLICKKKFTLKSNLIKHEKIHTGIKNYKCLICKKKFTEKYSLTTHERIHTGIKNYECLICKKKFMEKFILTQHERIHTGIKNYECLICKKKFTQKIHLINHETIHTGIKKYDCSICKKKFTRKDNLIQHERVHTGIKNYECLICKKKFMEKTALTKHERIHTGIKNYQCLICKKKFTDKSTLIRHETVHTGIKNYECSICKKKFSRKGNLIQHERIHTDIKT